MASLNTEQRQESIEIELSYQKDSIQELEKTVAHQYQMLQNQGRQIELLGQIIKDLKMQVGDSGIRPLSEEVPPPHY
jgi:uncharacterized coiled-coil protein SlyX